MSDFKIIKYNATDFDLKVLQRVRFWIEKKYNASDFEMKKKYNATDLENFFFSFIQIFKKKLNNVSDFIFKIFQYWILT